MGIAYKIKIKSNLYTLTVTPSQWLCIVVRLLCIFQIINIKYITTSYIELLQVKLPLSTTRSFSERPFWENFALSIWIDSLTSGMLSANDKFDIIPSLLPVSTSYDGPFACNLINGRQFQLYYIYIHKTKKKQQICLTKKNSTM